MVRRSFFVLGNTRLRPRVPPPIHPDTVPIYCGREVPDLDGFEEMEEPAIDAYPCRQETGIPDFGDFSHEIRDMAVGTVALHFGISKHDALEQFEICIVPGTGFHGRIMARKKA